MLIGKEIDLAINNVYQYLDTIDLIPYIEKYKGKEPIQLMSELEDNFPYEDKYSTSLFDAVSEDEFMIYLNEKYGIKFREVVQVNWYII